jgi:multidrug efflux pump subunit AcrB
MGIVRFALRWPYTFYVLALLTLFLGVTAFRSMPEDIFLGIDIPVVIWQYTGLSTPEREQRGYEHACVHGDQRRATVSSIPA